MFLNGAFVELFKQRYDGAAVSKTTVMQQHRPVHLNNDNIFIESLVK
jgi:hypothetical protein